jgi:hypothetical protein
MWMELNVRFCSHVERAGWKSVGLGFLERKREEKEVLALW